MKPAYRVVLTGAATILALAAVAVWVDRSTRAAENIPHVAPAAPAGVSLAALRAATFVDSDDRAHTLGQWQGKLLVVNFWATWCAPCMEEIPMLSALQRKHAPNGLQIVGIAADSAVNVKKFRSAADVSFPLLPDEAGAITLSKRLGNRLGLLPHTVAFSPQGDLVFAKLGLVTEAEIEIIVAKHGLK